jgi:hypothetical protein
MSVEERLARLERENRRLKVVGMLVMMIAAAVFLTGQSQPPSEIVAQRFTLVNGDGARIGELRANDGGLPYFALYEPGQTSSVISMGLTRMGSSSGPIGGPYLNLSTAPTSSSFASSVRLSVTDGMPGVTLYDRNAKGRVLLSIIDTPSISIWDEQITSAVWQAP